MTPTPPPAKPPRSAALKSPLLLIYPPTDPDIIPKTPPAIFIANCPSGSMKFTGLPLT